MQTHTEFMDTLTGEDAVEDARLVRKRVLKSSSSFQKITAKEIREELLILTMDEKVGSQSPWSIKVLEPQIMGLYHGTSENIWGHAVAVGMAVRLGIKERAGEILQTKDLSDEDRDWALNFASELIIPSYDLSQMLEKEYSYGQIINTFQINTSILASALERVDAL